MARTAVIEVLREKLRDAGSASREAEEVDVEAAVADTADPMEELEVVWATPTDTVRKKSRLRTGRMSDHRQRDHQGHRAATPP